MSTLSKSVIRPVLPVADRHPRIVALADSGITLSEYHDSIQKEVAKSPASTDSKRLLRELVVELCHGLELCPQRASGEGCSIPEVLSFAEHHASLSHPETSNVVANLASFSGGRGARVLSLTCGTTPLDNELFPRGVIVGSTPVALMSNRCRRLCAACAPPIDTTEARGRLEKALRLEAGFRASSEAILAWFDSCAPAVRELPTLWQQISVFNASLGRSMFEDGGIDYLCVPIELIASRLFRRWLESGEENWLVRAMVDSAAYEDFVATLDGVPGFFDRKKGRGTVMVWRDVGSRLAPVGLDDALKGRSRDEWLEALSEGTLLPSAGMAMLALAFVLGFPNFGGLLQYDYLAEARQRLLNSHSATSESERRVIRGVPDSYYVNFERRPATGGGLLRLTEPIRWGDLKSEGDLPVSDHVRDCLEWILHAEEKSKQ